MLTHLNSALPNAGSSTLDVPKTTLTQHLGLASLEFLLCIFFFEEFLIKYLFPKLEQLLFFCHYQVRDFIQSFVLLDQRTHLKNTIWS